MKQLILIAGMLLAMTAKLVAQDNRVIEITKSGIEAEAKEKNQFKIVTHEPLDINLKFNLKKEQTYNVIISNSKNKIVFARENYQEGKNKINFTTEEDEEYTVKLFSQNLTNLIVCLKENQ
ncbi:hypothetical protein [Flavobacterium sp. N1994]|uniref:hypothetical protein n=1 Tax=Flavobacterium sp. N1994 TaxID=2986827 RepID=UPI0022215E65|nr:hypothetical protein [Flavobacterium sp. N1994]